MVFLSLNSAITFCFHLSGELALNRASHPFLWINPWAFHLPLPWTGSLYSPRWQRAHIKPPASAFYMLGLQMRDTTAVSLNVNYLFGGIISHSSGRSKVCYVAKDNPELILLPLPPRPWDHRCAPTCLSLLGVLQSSPYIDCLGSTEPWDGCSISKMCSIGFMNPTSS